jgi:hypothetical protein
LTVVIKENTWFGIAWGKIDMMDMDTVTFRGNGDEGEYFDGW